MRSHFSLPRGVTTACAVAGASTMLNGNCSAQNLIAADYATNSAYANGWLDGQNAGYGFGPWSFGGTSGSVVQQGMTYTNSSPYNPLGTAWTLFNLVVDTNPPPSGDVANAGRSIPPLQVGQTIDIVLDNPPVFSDNRGYTISFNNSTNNFPSGSAAGQLFAAYTFEYFSYGRWYVGDMSDDRAQTSLFSTDTAPKGTDLTVTLTSTNTYHLTMTPLNNPTNAYTKSGTFKIDGPLNWIEFQFYNTQHDTNSATDFYISRMTISGGLALSIQQVGTNVLLSWPNVASYNLVSTTNLAAPVWNAVLPLPSVVNGRNVVTNPIAAFRYLYYRLQQ